MSKKVISAGHICLDITPIFPQDKSYEKLSQVLIPGKLINNIGAADVHTGGSVANTGLALKILGADVKLLCKVGDDEFGKLVQGIVASYGADGVLVSPGDATSYSVVLAVPGLDRIFLHCPGANNTFGSADIPDEALEDVALFHLGYPTLMEKLYSNDGEELLTLLRRVKERGIATSMDMTTMEPNSAAGQADWVKILSRVLPYTDFFLPSAEELCFMINRPRYDALRGEEGDMAANLDIEKDIKPMADKLIEMGCGTALIKCGTAGMYYRTANEARMLQVGANLELNAAAWAGKAGLQRCYKADKVLSGTGAGDTCIAAFLKAAMDGKAPAACAALAAAEGACAVTTYDALSGLKPLEELEARINAGWEMM
ncbi:MAG: carbohydrate kinase family protein [Clostridia bacterium]|nr:carbohydrate kinase family protein [Clostridia bacterium]